MITAITKRGGLPFTHFTVYEHRNKQHNDKSPMVRIAFHHRSRDHTNPPRTSSNLRRKQLNNSLVCA